MLCTSAGERVARRDAVCGQLAGDLRVHPFERQQRLLHVLHRFLARDRLGEERVARTAAQLVDRVLVERLDLEHLGDRHVRNFLERSESLADQDVGNFLVDVELLDEQRAQELIMKARAHWFEAETAAAGTSA